MSSKTLRRRQVLGHGDVDPEEKASSSSWASSDDLNEPLLGNSESHNSEIEMKQLHWALFFSNLIANWARWLATITRHFLTSTNSTDDTSLLLTPLQQTRLECLRRRLEVPFDGSRVEHQDALKQLWRLAFPDRKLPPLKSEVWKEMGWQGVDPATDFRGAGFIALENLVFFARRYPESFRRLLRKERGTRAEWEYPFAVAGVNLSFVLTQMLDLRSEKTPSSEAGIRFLGLLEGDEMAFDDLFCVIFEMMDAQWLAKGASYMEFNEVMKSTRAQLERELALEGVLSVKDLPAYKLLTE